MLGKHRWLCSCRRLISPKATPVISVPSCSIPVCINHSRQSHFTEILFTIGGPGGSGVQYVQELAPYFRAIIGPQYDLVGFDPRGVSSALLWLQVADSCDTGVGETTPVLSVFNSPAEALEFYAPYPQNANESVSSFGRSLAQAQILGKLAIDRVQQIAESVSTAAVATDMLSIARAFAFDKVNYWGVS